MNQTKKRHRLKFAILPSGTAQKKLKQRMNVLLVPKENC
jgi:hypothetical protein